MIPNKPLSTAAGFMLIDFFFFFLSALKGSSVPWRGIEPCPPHRQGRLLTSGPPGKILKLRGFIAILLSLLTAI